MDRQAEGMDGLEEWKTPEARREMFIVVPGKPKRRMLCAQCHVPMHEVGLYLRRVGPFYCELCRPVPPQQQDDEED